ncbi:hypothetical protein chiPu_0010055 [Chiloscyllium punctatum]|uniref:Integrase catalytic domain-containing protein n=1 Tax=Chiloscyllium punctatum TaxID=137246 RepID=A0A401SMG6_CHIPU|nr:hypothetical protein [Chiloscyllium punctatum]
MLTTGVWESRDGNLTGNPKEVKVTPQRSRPVTVQEDDQYGNEKLEALLATLWSQNDTDLGRLNTASPVEIRLKPGAGTVVKFLTHEVIPRLGITSEISSENGSDFIQKVVKLVLQSLRIKQRFGCVHHLQSQGMVESINGTLKAKLNKICASTDLNWVDALPLALMSYRMQTNRMTNLTLHEMLTDRLMPVPKWRGPYEGPSLEQLILELKQYMQQLTMMHETIHLQETQREPTPVNEKGPIKPGD